MTAPDLEARLDELESRVRISEIIARYCEGVDRKEPDVFKSIWHDDAEYLIGADRGNFTGLDDIARFPDIVRNVWKNTYHWTTNSVVTFQARDAASGVSECFAMCEKHDGGVCFVGARYVDEFSRRNGVWKLAKRRVQRWFQSTPQDLNLAPPA